MCTCPDGARLLRRVVSRCRAPNIIFHKNKMGSIIRSSGTVFYSHLYLNSRLGFNGLKYSYSVISVKMDSLPANTKNRESTRSWTAKVRFVSNSRVCHSLSTHIAYLPRDSSRLSHSKNAGVTLVENDSRVCHSL